MAGKKHQFILGLVIKKMREEGFYIHNVDGNYPGLFGEKLPLPPTILRHRPDALGVSDKGQIGIGEAKTENDLLNSRTFEQLHDFTHTELNNNKCQVFIGIPKSAEQIFEKKLQDYGLLNVDNMVILFIPNELINE